MNWIMAACAGFAAVGFLTIWWRTGVLQEEVRLLRIQITRMTLDEVSDEDRKRAEDGESIGTLTDHDRKVIRMLSGLKWAEEHPAEMAALQRDLESRAVSMAQPPLKNA